ncbi:O-antigen ligase like membrane protein [Hathewaya proteolytica DSM 3090]|uniref:O-antigen ligase like membrane protein n=1 Tax=Hathewaya proteolytica DSM 3090 TaxID=1121331 RepID=A0A1M6QTZ3_9CLOT|nr:O-antigen ligase family protein [Hathewaya proteolytica]SHK23635.1 O-antigen ligase like membrane protein [Hathewaya proteolytica DSM 3090]
MKKHETEINFIILLSSMLLCTLLKKNGIFVALFSIAYITGIYFKCKGNCRKFLYLSSLYFAIAILGHKINYNIAFVLYFIHYTKNNYKSILMSLKTFSVKKLNMYGIFFFVFGVYMVLSLLWAMNVKTSLEYITRYAVGATMLAMIILENKREEELKDTFRFITYLVSGILVIGILEILGFDFALPNHFVDHGMTYKEALRIPVTFFYNPNNYAIFLIMAFIISLADLFYKENKKFTLISLINLLMTLVNIVFSRARIALLTFFICIFVLLVFGIINIKRNKKFAYKTIKYSVIYGILIVGTFVIFSMFPRMGYYTGKFAKIPLVAEIRTIIKDKLQSEAKPDKEQLEKEIVTSNKVIGNEGSDSVRLTLMYNVAIHGVFKDKNLFGVGVGNSPNYLKTINNTHGIINVHCFWLEILCDFGVFIGLYTIITYLCFVNQLFRLRKIVDLNKDRYYLSGFILAVAMIFLVFGPSSVIHFPPFWIGIALSYSILDCYKKKTHKLHTDKKTA